jgi:hypothetical protein
MKNECLLIVGHRPEVYNPNVFVEINNLNLNVSFPLNKKLSNSCWLFLAHRIEKRRQNLIFLVMSKFQLGGWRQTKFQEKSMEHISSSIINQLDTSESFQGKTTTGGTKCQKLAKSVFIVILDTILRRKLF